MFRPSPFPTARRSPASSTPVTSAATALADRPHLRHHLTGPAVDATITAKNVGKDDEPMAIGWHPYFAVPSGDRKQALLHVPGQQVAAINNYGDVFPTATSSPSKEPSTTSARPRARRSTTSTSMTTGRSCSAQRRRRRDLRRPGEQLRRPHPRPLTGAAHHPGLRAADEAVCRHRGAVQLRRPFGKEWGSTNTGMSRCTPASPSSGTSAWRSSSRISSRQKESPREPSATRGLPADISRRPGPLTASCRSRRSNPYSLPH